MTELDTALEQMCKLINRWSSLRTVSVKCAKQHVKNTVTHMTPSVKPEILDERIEEINSAASLFGLVAHTSLVDHAYKRRGLLL